MKIGNSIISRITTLALAAGIAAALLCSCGGSGNGDETTAPDSETTPEVTTEQTTAKPETTEPETTEVTEPEPEPEPEHPTDDTNIARTAEPFRTPGEHRGKLFRGRRSSDRSYVSPDNGDPVQRLFLPLRPSGGV